MLPCSGHRQHCKGLGDVMGLHGSNICGSRHAWVELKGEYMITTSLGTSLGLCKLDGGLFMLALAANPD